MQKFKHRLLGLVALVCVALSFVPALASEQFTNFALSTLANSIGSGDTTLTLASTTNFPSSAPFRLTIQDSAASTPEIVYVTAVSGNVYTVTRGYESTTASAHSAGAQVAQFVTAGVIQSLSNGITGALEASNNLSDLSSVSTARTNLGLQIGTNVEAWSAYLDAVAGGTYGCGNLNNAGTFCAANSVTATAALNVFTSSLQGLVPASGGGTTKFLGADATWRVAVTSVGMTGDGVIFNSTVTGSPVTSSGTLTPVLLSQAAHTFLAGPTSGSAAQPTFRAIVGTDLPNPSATTLGGVESYAAVSNQFLTSISTSGVPVSAQPSCASLSNGASSCSTDTTNASNISSGTLNAARLPNPTTSSLGGVQAINAVAHNFLTAISTLGVPSIAQPAFTDIAGSLAATQLPAFTGDTVTTAGSSATTTQKVNGVAYPASPTSTYVPVVTASNTVSYLSPGATLDDLSGAISGTYGVLARNISGQWAAYQQGFIDMNLYGASTASTSDATTIINNAATAAAAATPPLPLYFPCGIYNHSGIINIPGGVILFGQSKYCTILNATSNAAVPTSAIVLTGTNVGIRQMTLTGNSTQGRTGNTGSDAISVTSATNFDVEDIEFYGVASAGFSQADIEVQNSSNGRILRNDLYGGSTVSNPILFYNVQNAQVDGNYVTGGGDTCIEVSSPTTGTQNSYIDIGNNRVYNCAAHGISVVGGVHETLHDNLIGTPTGRGIYIASESGFSNVDDVTSTNDKIIGPGTDFGILVTGYSTSFPVTNVTLINPSINLTAAATVGVQFGSCDSCSSSSITASNIKMIGGAIKGDGTHGGVGVFFRGVNNAAVKGVSISTLQGEAFASIDGNGGTMEVSGNQISNINLGNVSAADGAVYLQTASGFTHHSILGNTYTAGADAINYFLVCQSSTVADVIFGGMSGDTTTVSGCTSHNALFSSLPTTQSGSYTFAAADATNFMQMNCSAACNLTVPPNSTAYFPVGQTLCFAQTGAGLVTIVAGSGVTITTYDTLNMNGQYAGACVRQTAVNTWLAVGQLQ